jgi:acyl-CoA synthetase (AMP-forming)/AMP-acid ligase II
MLASELRELGPGSVYIHTAPITHGSGAKVLPVLLSGGTNVVLPRFDPYQLADAIDEHGGTHTFLVPTIIQRLLSAERYVWESMARLRQISFGGSPIAPKVFREAIAVFGPILTQVYGTSEVPHPVSLLRPLDYRKQDDRVLSSAGRATLGVEVAMGDDHDAPVRSGSPGELLVRAPHAMCGYWRDDAATDAAFTADGFYRSGDLARIDPDGLITFLDRARDVIISGGLNIYPSEVERVISQHPGVKEVVVVGAPDAEWGEAVVAFVVPRGTVPPTEAQVTDWTKDRIAAYKKPRKIVFVAELPTNSTGKVLRRELREQLWSGASRAIG